MMESRGSELGTARARELLPRELRDVDLLFTHASSLFQRHVVDTEGVGDRFLEVGKRRDLVKMWHG